MVKVTDRAADQLQEMLATKNAPPTQGVKLAPTGNDSFGMSIAAPVEGDEVVRRDDRPLLIVDSRIAASLDGMEVDCDTTIVEGEAQPTFTLQPSA